VTSRSWQLGLDAARLYEDVLVRTILGPFARALVEELAPGAGDVVVDVGCGTGAAARCAAERVGSEGAVLGLDVNDAMLEVARSVPARGGANVEWRAAPAEDLPLANACADVVVCAQALQFVRSPLDALREMRRVARPGARIGISVWCALGENVYFDALVGALARHLGPEAAAGLLAAFSLSDRDRLLEVLGAAIPHATVEVRELRLALPPPDEFVPRHLAGTPVAPAFDAAPASARASLLAAARERLASYADGELVRIPFRSWFVLASL
jgi:SAM-dependent methyltransferase